MLIQIFRAIEKRVGSVSPQFLMTDDAEQNHNAWKEVFRESNTRKILCAWHVYPSWRKALYTPTICNDTFPYIIILFCISYYRNS